MIFSILCSTVFSASINRPSLPPVKEGQAHDALAGPNRSYAHQPMDYRPLNCSSLSYVPVSFLFKVTNPNGSASKVSMRICQQPDNQRCLKVQASPPARYREWMSTVWPGCFKPDFYNTLIHAKATYEPSADSGKYYFYLDNGTRTMLGVMQDYGYNPLDRPIHGQFQPSK